MKPAFLRSTYFFCKCLLSQFGTVGASRDLFNGRYKWFSIRAQYFFPPQVSSHNILTIHCFVHSKTTAVFLKRDIQSTKIQALDIELLQPHFCKVEAKVLVSKLGTFTAKGV